MDKIQILDKIKINILSYKLTLIIFFIYEYYLIYILIISNRLPKHDVHFFMKLFKIYHFFCNILLNDDPRHQGHWDSTNLFIFLICVSVTMLQLMCQEQIVIYNK